MNVAIFLPLIIAICIAITSYPATKESSLICEELNGIGFKMIFNEWSAQNKCELSLKENDTVEVKMISENGKISLVIVGKNGSKVYSGNALKTSIFTVTVSESDTYIIHLSGKKATGSLAIQKVKDF